MMPAKAASKPTDAPVKRERLNPEVRKNQLLDCAAELLVEGGAEALTMEGLAARAGVNKALPYYYFKTREAVVLALYEREYAVLATHAAAAVDAAPDFEGKVRGLVGAWLDQLDRPDVLGGIGTVRTESEVLERAQRRHNIEAALFVAQLLEERYDLAGDVALVAAGTTLSSSSGFLEAWSASRLAREDAVDLFVEMTVAAAEAASAFSPSRPSRPARPTRTTKKRRPRPR